MLHIAGWTLCLYLGIKFCHLVAGPALGIRRDEVSWTRRLSAGEPMLLVGTVSLCALIVGYGTWWTHRFAQGHYAYATDCYGKMAASHLLPGRPGRFGSYDAAEAATGYVRSAEIHGAQLGMRVDDIDRKLTEGRSAWSVYFTRLAAGNARPRIAASFRDLDRCLNGDGIPRGEILSPV